MSLKCSDPCCNIRDPLFKGDYVKCFNCLNIFHFTCAGVKESTERRKAKKEKEKWRCKQFCRAKKDTESESEGKKDEVDDVEVEDDDKQLLSVIKSDELKLIYLALNIKMNQVINSVSFMSKKYDEIMVKVNENDKLVNDLKKDIMKKDREIQEIANKVEELEQYTRKENIEIHGIEKQEKDTDAQLYRSVFMLFEKWSIPVHDQDVSIVHRLYSRNQPDMPPIILRLKDRRLKEKILDMSKKVKDKRQGQVLLKCRDKEKKIFICENPGGADSYGRTCTVKWGFKCCKKISR